MEDLENMMRIGVAVSGLVSGCLLGYGSAMLEWRIHEVIIGKELYDKGKLGKKPTLWNIGRWRSPYNLNPEYFEIVKNNSKT